MSKPACEEIVRRNEIWKRIGRPCNCLRCTRDSGTEDMRSSDRGDNSEACKPPRQPVHRRSWTLEQPTLENSFGYLIQLYGGPIDWKASKQATVTTLNTEA